MAGGAVLGPDMGRGNGSKGAASMELGTIVLLLSFNKLSTSLSLSLFPFWFHLCLLRPDSGSNELVVDAVWIDDPLYTFADADGGINWDILPGWNCGILYIGFIAGRPGRIGGP